MDAEYGETHRSLSLYHDDRDGHGDHDVRDDYEVHDAHDGHGGPGAA